jgi:hypothetical protein
MDYNGIVDVHNIDWYSSMLEHSKLLDMNNFLHNISLYVVYLSYLQPRAPSATIPHIPSILALHGLLAIAPFLVNIDESRDFDFNSEDMYKDNPLTSINPHNYGSLFSKEGLGFNQFESMVGVISRLVLLERLAQSFALEKATLSLSQEYGLQDGNLPWIRPQ